MARSQLGPIDRALVEVRESRNLDFKRMLDVGSTAEWCEIIKDVVAMANSGGGIIAIGLDDSGSPCGWNPKPLLDHDPAILVDKIAKYTGEQFDEVTVISRKKGRRQIALIVVGERVGSPLIFEKEGTYQLPSGANKCAFAKGSVYFRHGAKSEPGVSRDLLRFSKLEESRIKRELLGHISKVSKAPRGAEVLVLEQDEKAPTHGMNVRVVSDPRAPAVGVINQDQMHPLLLHEVLDALNLQIGANLNPHDLLCVRKVHSIDTRPAFFYKPLHGSPQYSHAYVQWLADRYEHDPKFFTDAREQAKPKSGS